MCAAGQRALRADGAAGQCGVCAQAGVLAIGLHTGRGNRGTVDFNRAADISDDTRRRDGGLELSDAGAVDRQVTQLAIDAAADRAGKGHRAAAGIHRQAVGFRSFRIHCAGEQDRVVDRRQCDGVTEGHRAGIGLRIGAADGIGMDRGRTGYFQRGQAADAVLGGIAEHSIAIDQQAMAGAGYGTFGRDGSTGQRDVVTQRERVVVGLRAAGADAAAVDRHRTRGVGGDAGGGYRRAERGDAGAVDAECIDRIGAADDAGEGDVACPGSQGQIARGEVAVDR